MYQQIYKCPGFKMRVLISRIQSRIERRVLKTKVMKHIILLSRGKVVIRKRVSTLFKLSLVEIMLYHQLHNLVFKM